MDQLEIMQHIDELEREIATLPPGAISAKKVRVRQGAFRIQWMQICVYFFESKSGEFVDIKRNTL